MQCKILASVWIACVYCTGNVDLEYSSEAYNANRNPVIKKKEKKILENLDENFRWEF